jgi:two-component SAPR family response regulator
MICHIIITIEGRKYQSQWRHVHHPTTRKGLWWSMMNIDITITLKIGLVEDEVFDVDAFTDPELALSNYKSGLYDLVLIDIKMPKMDGFELYEQLKKVDPDVNVCFLTASEMYHEEMREIEHCT